MKQQHTLTREQRIEASRKELAKLKTKCKRTRGFRRGIIADEILVVYIQLDKPINEP